MDQLSKGGRETTPYHTTRDQVYLIESISTIMENYFSSLFANFHNYTIRDLTDPANPISVFIKESFLCDTHDTSFFAPFLSSQIFFHYSDKRLRKRDDIVKVCFYFIILLLLLLLFIVIITLLIIIICSNLFIFINIIIILIY